MFIQKGLLVLGIYYYAVTLARLQRTATEGALNFFKHDGCRRETRFVEWLYRVFFFVFFYKCRIFQHF